MRLSDARLLVSVGGDEHRGVVDGFVPIPSHSLRHSRPSRAARVARGLRCVVLTTGLFLLSTFARAENADAVFSEAIRALDEGRHNDAIASLESMADQGLVDAAVSFDRGLAYALRARTTAETPGDLGRAVHGFEEARSLTKNPALRDAAERALALVRGEIAHRRTRAGEASELSVHRTLWRTVVTSASERTWSALALVGSLVFALGLFARAFGQGPRVRVGGTLTAALGGPTLLFGLLLVLGARYVRRNEREGIVVSPTARPADSRHIVMAGAAPLPEGARVIITEPGAAWTRVNWGGRAGTEDIWLPSQAVRPLAE